MTSPQQPPQPEESSQVVPDEPASGEPFNFEQELQEAERSLQELKDHHHQFQSTQQQVTGLHQQQEQLTQEKTTPPVELSQELTILKHRLKQLESDLDNRIFAWIGLKPFWQAIRFGGLGLIVGWFLAFAVLQSPRPVPENTPPVPQNPQP